MIRNTPSNLPTSDSTHWANMREAGTLLGLRFLYGLHALFGRSLFKLVLVFVGAYFVVTRREHRRASKEYLATHYHHFPEQWSSAPGLRQTYQHFCEFGETILDKLLAWKTDISEDSFHVINQQAIDEVLKDSRGQLIIGTHLGNLEYCRGFMCKNQNKIINILIHDRHSANFARIMESVNPESRLNIYQVDEMDIVMILNLKAKIDAGEWLFIAGDRIPLEGHHRIVSVDFLGRQASLPIGPYQLAKTLGCPVKLMFAYRQNRKVTVDLLPFCDKLDLPRDTRLDKCQHFAQLFATELERHCEEVPFQWFNFYDFWALPAPAKFEKPKG